MTFGNQVLAGLALETMVKSFVLLAAALAVAWSMRRSSAAIRHLLLAAAAVALLALPLASMVMPSWSIVALPGPLGPADGDGSPVTAAPARPGTQDSLVPAVPGASPGAEPGGTAPAATAEKAGRGSPAGAGWLGIPWHSWLLLVWAAGSSILVLRLVGGKIYGSMLAAAAPAMRDERIQAMVRAVSGKLGLARPVPVSESDYLKVPFVCGSLRPKLILPPKAREWPREKLVAVLRHELAHVRRMDVLTQFLAQIACCIYWMNPLVWILERRLFMERERACDDIAVRPDIEPSRYAEHLMEIMEELNPRRSHAWVISAMAEGTDFKDRILSILDPVARRTAPGQRHLAAVSGVSLLLVLILSALHPAPGAAASPDEVTARGVARSDRQDAAPDRPRRRGSGAAQRSERGDDRQVDALVALLENHDPDTREHAAEALGRSGSPRAVPGLVKALGDSDRSVREHVASALGQIGDSSAVPHLIEVLLSDPDNSVREHAASALGMLGDNEDGYRTLVSLYESDPSASVRAHAAYALGKMGALRAFDLLVGGLRDDHPEIRVHCADALGLLGDAGARPHLEQALEDPDRRVREAAGRALRRLRWNR